MEAIKYEKTPMGCMLTTPCPHGFKGGKRYNNVSHLSPVSVGSHLCRQCPCFGSNNAKARIVKCKYKDMKKG